MEEKKIFGKILKKIENNYLTYNIMNENFSIIEKNPEKILCFDFSETTFLQGNMVVYLDLLKRFHYQINGKTCELLNYPEAIKELLERNGYIKREIKNKDNRKTTITFSRHYFKETDVEKFCEYITSELLNHYRMNFVSLGLKDKILESVLELFNNVIQHTSSEFLSTCGQFFPNTKKMIFSIGNLGETFYNKISSKIQSNDPAECIEWALGFSNSTKSETGGLGLYTFNEFLKLNCGTIQIISGTGFFEKQFMNKEKIVKKQKLKYNFPGTIVTFIVDLNQNLIYENENLKLD